MEEWGHRDTGRTEVTLWRDGGTFRTWMGTEREQRDRKGGGDGDTEEHGWGHRGTWMGEWGHRDTGRRGFWDMGGDGGGAKGQEGTQGWGHRGTRAGLRWRRGDGGIFRTWMGPEGLQRDRKGHRWGNGDTGTQEGGDF